ncbi:MAG TPA: hypothetical protein VEZ90_15075 [Blastocatellia bacterium]|nr:hypothetical protein [Blastocatellia bacterium]
MFKKLFKSPKNGGTNGKDTKSRTGSDHQLNLSLVTYIENTFGNIPTVFHEIVSDEIHVDIHIIPPTEKTSPAYAGDHGDV